MSNKRGWVLALLGVAVGAIHATGSEIAFNDDVRPIFAENCLECHGPDQDNRKADLRLDQRESAAAVIEPERPAESELYRRITAAGSDDLMPPPESGKELEPEQIELLRQWIEEGAEWQRHWAFIPPERPGLPEVDHRDWIENPVDHFVLAQLEAKGIEPSPEADRATLIRRLSLDLLGLPPSPAEVETFVADDRPNAYGRLVDRLLDSPHFGERWGRHWLDLARYADSDGFLGDGLRPHAWRYRDWVINAVNRDMPFDEFTVWQLAGDLLSEPTTEQLVATGFHRNAPRNKEAGVNEEMARTDMVKDRTDTTGTVWLGMTLACAKCHTHKYDPVTIRDYYEMFAFFNNTMDRDISAPRQASLAEHKQAHAEWEDELEDLEAALQAYEENELPKQFQEWIARGDPREDRWSVLYPSSDGNPGNGTTGDGFFEVGKDEAREGAYEIELDPEHWTRPVTGIRLEVGEAVSFPRLEAPGAPTGESNPSGVELRRSSGKYLDVGTLGGLGSRLGEGVTVSAWIKTTSDERMFITGVVNPGQQLLFLNVNEEPGSGKIRAFLRREDGSGLGATTPFDAGVTDGNWHHVAAVWEPDEPLVTLYVDGEAVFESGGGPSLADGWINWEVPIFLGAVNLRGEPSDDYFEGLMDEVVFFDRALTAREIEAHQAARSDDYAGAVRADDPLAYWRLDEISGTRVADSGGQFSGTVAGPETQGFRLTGFQVSALEDGERRELAIRAAKASASKPKHPIESVLDEDSDQGWSIGDADYRPQAAVFELEQPYAPATTAESNGFAVGLGLDPEELRGSERFRISITHDETPLAGPVFPQKIARILRGNDDEKRPSESGKEGPLMAFYRTQDKGYNRLKSELARHREAEPTRPETQAPVVRARSDLRETHVHIRGDHARPGAKVEPAGLSALPSIEANGNRPTRLDLARWLVSLENPLTSRVTVNRIWSRLFGEGLVRTPDDFGTRGEKPTHPRLLDWLATEFPRVGWSRKALIRRIVMSATYRQSSRFRPELAEVDANNRLLARQSRFRLEAEVIRDSFLEVGGLLNKEIGGRSIRPPLPPDISGVGRDVPWPVSEGPERYKRGMYILVRRSVAYPMLATFDAPDASESCVRRDRSNTPLQALTLLNDPVFFEAAQSLGMRVFKEADGNVDDRLRDMFRRCFAREPRGEEMARLKEFYQAQRRLAANGNQEAMEVLEDWNHSGLSDQERVEAATLIAVARIVMNLDEFINRE